MSKTVDDSDPNYAWIGDSWLTDHTADFLTPQYSNGTFHSSTKNGDYCIIAWKGTDISVFGARRTNHGIYGVQVDGGAIQYYSGYSTTDQLQQVLYATTGLADGNHQIKLSNENARNIAQYPDYIWFDIDHVALTGTLLNANANANANSQTEVKPSTSSTTQPAPSSSFSPPTPVSSSTSVSAIISSVASSTSTISAASSAVSSGTKSASPSSSTGLGSVGQYSPSGAIASFSRLTSSGAITSSSPMPTTDSSGAEDEGKSGKKTTVIAVSVTVIVIAAVFIATIAGLWWWRRRRRLREEEDDDQRDYLAPQSSWR